jgi:hypothetical protein
LRDYLLTKLFVEMWKLRNVGGTKSGAKGRCDYCVVYYSILYIEGEKCMIFPKVQFVARGRSPRATKHRGKMSILSRSIYTIFFTVGSRNSTKISNFKNKKMMTNELSSFDEFNGISSCLDNTIRFLSQQSKKMKTPIRFLSQLSKK